jgi:hypothetical protein
LSFSFKTERFIEKMHNRAFQSMRVKRAVVIPSGYPETLEKNGVMP